MPGPSSAMSTCTQPLSAQRRDRDRAVLAERADRVVEQVRPDLVELGAAHRQLRQRLVVVALDLDLRVLELVAEHDQRALEALVDVGADDVAAVHVGVGLDRLDEAGTCARWTPPARPRARARSARPRPTQRLPRRRRRRSPARGRASPRRGPAVAERLGEASTASSIPRSSSASSIASSASEASIASSGPRAAPRSSASRCSASSFAASSRSIPLSTNASQRVVDRPRRRRPGRTPRGARPRPGC